MMNPKFKNKIILLFCNKKYRNNLNDKIVFSVGPDWEWGNQDGGNGAIGSVYCVRNNGTVCVRIRFS